MAFIIQLITPQTCLLTGFYKHISAGNFENVFKTCINLSKTYQSIGTCDKTCVAVWFRKTSVYRNSLHIGVSSSRSTLYVPLVLQPV